MFKGKRIGLALGGGGARGFAHWSVLRSLAKNGIEVDVISGTSMGSVIASAHFQKENYKHSYHSLKKFVIKYADRFSKMNTVEAGDSQKSQGLGRLLGQIETGYNLMQFLSRDYIGDPQLIEDIMHDFLKPCNLKELRKKVFICCLDVKTGRAFFTNEGEARKFVGASMSVPGYFPALPFEGRLLFDAQSMYPVPIQIFQYEPVDFIISVDVGVPVEQDFKPSRAADILFRQIDMSYSHIISEVYHCSDLVIKPKIDGVHWTHFHKMDEVMQAGVEAVEEALPNFYKLIEQPNKPAPKHRPWHNYGFPGTDRVDIYPSNPTGVS